MVVLVLDVIITVASAALFIYWFHLACLFLVLHDDELEDLMDLLDRDHAVLSRWIFGNPIFGDTTAWFEWLDHHAMSLRDSANHLFSSERQEAEQAHRALEIKLRAAAAKAAAAGTPPLPPRNAKRGAK